MRHGGVAPGTCRAARRSTTTPSSRRSSDALLSKRQLAEIICDEIREVHKEPGCVAAAAGLIDKYCRMFGFYEPERHEVDLRGALAARTFTSVPTPFPHPKPPKTIELKLFPVKNWLGRLDSNQRPID